jgi:hypothetical protein
VEGTCTEIPSYCNSWTGSKKYALRMGLQKAQRHKRRIIIASENEHVNVECLSQCWIITDKITVRQLAAID